MTIERHTPNRQVNKWVTDHVSAKGIADESVICFLQAFCHNPQ